MAAGAVWDTLTQYNSLVCPVVKEVYNGLLLSEFSCSHYSSGYSRLCDCHWSHYTDW